tara:strand:+ start:705 stop:1316 length:612 start_codon:yes stop_codon:yes gene_type:complete
MQTLVWTFRRAPTGWKAWKGGEAWTILVGYNLTITLTRRSKMKNVKSSLSKVLGNTAKDNSNKEVTVKSNAAASATVTLTKAEYEALLKPKKSGAKVCTKKWSCIMSKKQIKESSAPPQMQMIMQSVRQETEEYPDRELHDSAPIIDRLLDDDNDYAMTFGRTKYKSGDRAVKHARIVDIMNYYANPDQRAKADVDTELFDAR